RARHSWQGRSHRRCLVCRSPAPAQWTEDAAIKRGETPEDWKDKPRKLCQKDLDALWAKKNNKVHYGYKNHLKADVKTKLVRDFRVSAASEHDSQCLEELVKGGDGTVYADSAYRSRGSMAMLRRKKVK
ncbi:transposase, partial [Luteolibacter pohnpeiensis]